MVRKWQDLKIDDLETGTIVLVHGGGFGAWCWYKTIVFLEESGFKVIALDLTGCGVHSFDTNNITSLSQYVKPLTDFLEKLADGEKVSSFVNLNQSDSGSSIFFSVRNLDFDCFSCIEL